MGRKAHELRDRAIHLMRSGMATPGEIARAGEVSIHLVRNWRRRAGLYTDELRVDRVRKLLMRGNGHVE